MSKKFIRTKLPLHVVAILVSAGMLMPLVWMVSTSLKPPSEVFSGVLNVVPVHPTLENYAIALTKVPFLRYIANSLIVATTVTLGQLLLGILAAYAFTRFEFPGRNLLFFLCLGALSIPFQVIMIPNYVLVSQLGWLNTYQGLIAPELAGTLGIFLLRQQFRAFPTPLIEAAALDGASSWQTLWRIVVPITVPALVAIGAIIFLGSWNSYLWPLLVATDRDMLMIQPAVQEFSSREGGTSWGPLTAAATLATLVPFVAFVFFQRRIMESFVHSGIR